MADITIGGMTPAGRSLAPTDKLEIEATGPLGLYLTGQNIIDTCNAQTDLRILAPVATLIALKAINTSSLVAGTAIECAESTRKYVLEKNNTTAHTDGWNGVRPTTNSNDIWWGTDIWAGHNHIDQLLTSTFTLSAAMYGKRIDWNNGGNSGTCILPPFSGIGQVDLIDQFTTTILNIDGTEILTFSSADEIDGDSFLYPYEAAIIILEVNSTARFWTVKKIPKSSFYVKTISGTTHTPGLVNMGAVNNCTSATAVTITLPNDAAIPVGNYASYIQAAAGQLNFVAGSGVNPLVNPYNAFKSSNHIGSRVNVLKYSANTWLVDGDTVV